MAQFDAGPASGNAELFLGTPKTCGVEVHVPAGLNSLAPVDAPHVDPTDASNLMAATGGNAQVKGTFAGVRFAIPA